jgi:hypothetical protein
MKIYEDMHQIPYLPIFVAGILLNDLNKTSDFNATSVCAIRNVILADLIKSTMART